MLVSSIEFTRARFPILVVERCTDGYCIVVPDNEEKIPLSEFRNVKRAAKEAGCTAEFLKKGPFARRWAIQYE